MVGPQKEGFSNPLDKYASVYDLEKQFSIMRRPARDSRPWTLTDEVRKNKFVTHLGCTRYTMPLSECGQRYSSFSGNADQASVDGVSVLARNGKNALFLAPLATHANVSKRCAKLLLPPCYDFRDQPDWVDVKHSVDAWCASLWTNISNYSKDQIELDLVTDTSPGKMFKSLGAKTKQDVFTWGLFPDLLDRCDASLPADEQHIPVYSCAPKLDEILPATGLLSASTIVGDKIRLIFPAEPEYVYLEKRFFGMQNKLLMNAPPSAYGLNVFKGGFKGVFDSLQSASGAGSRFFCEWDVSGYDARFPHMSEVSRLRYKHLGPCTPKESAQARWVLANSENSVCLMPDGSFYLFTYGNRSGKGNTTGDNIIGHMFPLAMFFGRLTGDYSLIRNDRRGFVYGDDLIASICSTHTGEHIGQVAVDTFKLFGWTLDPVFIVTNLLGRSFLGAKFSLYKGMIVPKYDHVKLCTSVIAGAELPPDAYAAKLLSILVMLCVVDNSSFDVVRDLLFSHCKVSCARAPSPVVRAVARGETERSLERSAFVSFVTGREGPTLLENLFGKKATRGRQSSRTPSHTCSWECPDYCAEGQIFYRMPQTVAQKKKKSRKAKQKMVNAPKRAPGTKLGPRPKPGFSRQRQLTGQGQTRNTSVKMGRRSATFSEDEYIAEVVGPGTGANFSNTAYSVNPGNPTTFPWLSTIAKQFEKYEFESLEFYYKREVSEFATAGTTGKVIMSFDADASDPPPALKKQMEDTDPHVDAMPCQNMSFVIPKSILKRLNSGFCVRGATLPGGGDIKTFDVGNLNIATQALASNTATVGELHVRYRVRLFVPVLESSTTAPTNYQAAQLISSVGESVSNGSGYTLLFADTSSALFANGLGAVNTSGSIVLPAGNYMFSADVQSVNTGVSTQWILAVKKNASTLSVQPTFTLVGQTSANVSQSCNVYFSVNGTDAITVVVTNSFSTGTSTVYGSLKITAL